ncbi:MAG: glycosyltransferase family 39 protein [Bacteroidales bacterium]|nr:glycosyltransferase family 39 protein [Bacteroidales bacterium]
MRQSNIKIYRILFWLIVVSTILRGVLASVIEFGNDEVYYWTYALYPDLSHFDHPPMVGFVIQMFSLDLLFQDEFFIRLGSIVFGSVNIYLIFIIAKKINGSIAGLYAAFLYTSSIYVFVICGIFILPDTPQNLFWLLGIYFFVSSLPDKQLSSKSRKNLLLAGLVCGLGVISKHTSVFLWLGAVLFIVFYNRKWLKAKQFYFAIIISLLCLLPVVWWNYHNDFISFTYQGERVNVSDSGVRFDYFFTELFGQILYNNPVNFIIIILALIAFFRKKIPTKNYYIEFLLFSALPLISIFLIFSLFRSTLPHWTGPAYSSLIIIASVFLSNFYSKKNKTKLFPLPIKLSISFLIIVIALSVGQINFGLISLDKNTKPQKLGENDFSLDLYGWEELGEKFEKIRNNDLANNIMNSDAAIISYRWFPAANLDYYVARPLEMRLFAFNKLEKIHKYAWINKYRGKLEKGMDAYFITSSRDYFSPFELYGKYFAAIEAADTINIFRDNKNVLNYFIFRMKDLKNESINCMEQISYGN